MLLSDGARPTEDIYFLRSVAPWLRRQGGAVVRVDTRRWRSPGFCWPWLRRLLRGARVLVCRSLATPWLDWLEAHRRDLASLYYLIDDDIPAAAADARLPPAYRQRMGRIGADQQPRLFALADEVVAASPDLAAVLRTRHRCVSVLPPPLIAPLPSLAHFAKPGWRLGYHGTRAHLPDLERILPALTTLHECHPSLAFEVMLGRHTPAALARLPRVSTPEPLAWRRFRAYQRRQRFQIGVSPLWPTPFNAGKSYIKFLDIVAMGGVGLYSHRPPYTEIVDHGDDGLLVEDTPAAWLEGLQRLVADPAATRRMAERAAQKAQDLGDPAHACRFWWARR